MKLTKKIEYALMGLYFLAYVRPHDYVQVRTVAEEIDVPKRFLEQIFLGLREQGILDSRRGSQGGYSLAVPTGEISLALLFRVLEDGNLPSRPPLGGSGARRFVWTAQAEIWRELEAVTVETLLTPDLKEYLRSGSDASVFYHI